MLFLRRVNKYRKNYESKAPFFGIDGNFNKVNAAAFEQTIINHVNGTTTQVIPGTFRKATTSHSLF